ncbi:TPA: hypothetical protein QHC32_005094 [Enterobacter roggenkampii]|nr:hypothetical protein [Enterobacter roggenkampii]
MTDDDFDKVRDKVMYGIGFDDFLDVKNEGESVPDVAADSVVIAAEVSVAEVEEQKKAI